MNLNNINMKEKEMLVKRIGEMYQDATMIVKQNIQTPRIEEKESEYLCASLKRKIDEILKGMRLEYAFIIQKEFLEDKKVRWYEDYFSLEEYKLYKKGAIDSFLHCLYG